MQLSRNTYYGVQDSHMLNELLSPIQRYINTHTAINADQDDVNIQYGAYQERKLFNSENGNIRIGYLSYFFQVELYNILHSLDRQIGNLFGLWSLLSYFFSFSNVCFCSICRTCLIFHRNMSSCLGSLQIIYLFILLSTL